MSYIAIGGGLFGGGPATPAALLRGLLNALAAWRTMVTAPAQPLKDRQITLPVATRNQWNIVAQQTGQPSAPTTKMRGDYLVSKLDALLRLGERKYTQLTAAPPPARGTTPARGNAPAGGRRTTIVTVPGLKKRAIVTSMTSPPPPPPGTGTGTGTGSGGGGSSGGGGGGAWSPGAGGGGASSELPADEQPWGAESEDAGVAPLPDAGGGGGPVVETETATATVGPAKATVPTKKTPWLLILGGLGAGYFLFFRKKRNPRRRR
jgi:hypothetical protein